MYHVALCCSGGGGAMQLAVAVRSVLETHSQADLVRVHIVWEHLTEEELGLLRESWHPWSQQVSFYRASEYLGEKALSGYYGYYFRWWLCEILPESVERVLYLDYDIIVKKDLAPLWSLELGDYLAGAVPDSGSQYLKSVLGAYAPTIGVEYSQDLPYFNTGVLFMNLRAWKEKAVAATLDERFADLRPHDSLEGPKLHDQTEFNLIFHDQVLALSPTWNLLELVNSFDEWCTEIYRELDEPSNYFDPRVVHFAGPWKAFTRWRRSSEKESFYSLLDRTAWSGWRSENDRTLKGKLFSQLLECHWLVCRGYILGFVPDYKSRLWKLVRSNPLLPIIYLVVPANRMRHRVLDWWRSL